MAMKLSLLLTFKIHKGALLLPNVKITWMNPFRLFALFFVFTTALSSCDKTPDFEKNTFLSIMPLGDSRVQGSRPAHESYRYELWKMLVDEGRQFDFVGNRKDEQTYPSYNDLELDKDHQGTGGAQTQDILSAVNNLDVHDMPNVVLLGIGGNDLVSGEKVETVIARIQEIIDILQDKNPTISIFIEQIAPAHSSFMTDDRWALLNAFNTAIPQIAVNRSISLVVVVDMSLGWSDDYFADNVHYNEIGAKVVAERYFEAIVTHLD